MHFFPSTTFYIHICLRIVPVHFSQFLIALQNGVENFFFSLSPGKKLPFQVAVEFPTFLLVSVSTQCVYIRLPTVSSDKVDLEFQINLFSLV